MIERWTAAFLLATVSMFVICEIVLRTTYHDTLRDQAYPSVYRDDPQIGYRYVAGARGFICNAYVCNAFEIGDSGFTHPVHPRKRSDDVYRIAVVGSSNETGIWMGPGKNYLELVEEHFAAAGIRGEVINLSIDGAYRDVEKVILAGSDALEFAPDLVLLTVEIPFRYIGAHRAEYRGYMIAYYGANPTSLEAARAYIDWLLDHRILIALYDSSYIVRAAAKYYTRNPNRPYVNAVLTYMTKRFDTPDFVLRPISTGRSLQALKDLKARLSSRGADLLLFRYVDDPQWEDALASAGMPHIVLDVVQTKDTTYGDLHYSAAGHRLLAQHLFDALAKRGLPPPAFRHVASRPAEQ